MATANHKLVTYKTLFLLTLASAKRISEIHALQSKLSWHHKYKAVTIPFDPKFLAKTQNPGDYRTHESTITIQALTQVLGAQDIDRFLCPLRALRFYMSRTKSFRHNSENLFLSLSGQKAVEKMSLSVWIRSLIKMAYELSEGSDSSLITASTHEIRALATSLAFTQNCSLQSVMEAACWRSHSTFSDFYLRDLSLSHDNILALGPIVAGQTIIGLTPSK
jgi:hypothetical protein